MIAAIWGYKTFNRSEVPVLVWVGSNMDEGAKTLASNAAKLGIIRAEKQQLFHGIRMPLPESGQAINITPNTESTTPEPKKFRKLTP